MKKTFPQRSQPLSECLARLHIWGFADFVVVCLFMAMLFYSQQTLAQIKITFPISRQIIQRDNSNQAIVQIVGSYGQPLDVIEARVVARAAGQGTNTDWITLQNNPSNGQFVGTMVVKGGWYTIEVQGRKGGAIVATDALDRFGVGEVFAIMGHSNAQGSACTIDGTDRCPTRPGAVDDRVNVIAVDQNSDSFNQYLSTADTQYLPGLAFSQLTATSGIAPFAKMPWLWGRMGDALVSRINVPVLLYNAGFGGTNMQQTYWAASNIPFQHSFVNYSIRMPYANIRNLMNLYVPTTGIRAVLVHHGLNDRGNPADSTYKYYNAVIDSIRHQFNKPDLGFLIALDSYVGSSINQNVRSAQQRVINPTGNKTYLGPDLDVITSRTDRPDGVHYAPSGQVKAGDLWANAITDSYLTTLATYPGQQQPLATVSCASSNQLTLAQPTGYQYSWSTGSTANPLTMGAGTYSARIVDAKNKVLFPPAVVVPASIKPVTPTITTNNGTTIICKDGGLTLSSSYAGPNSWNTGSSAQSIVASTVGVYTVQAKNAVYGCLSDPATITISGAGSNLSLSMQTSRRVVALNDTVSYQLIIKNNGGCDVERVTLQNRLPPNLTVVSTSSSLTVDSGDIYGSTKMIDGLIKQIPAGQWVSASYTARITAHGTYINAFELITTFNPPVNANLGNGTGNGEEDEARADLRTTGSSSDIFISPNPNQGTLPLVQSSQPLPKSNEADLSLIIQSSSRAVTIGQSVVFTLTVSNRGTLTATHIGLKDLLPTGVQFVSSTSGMSVSGNVVSGMINQIPSGQSVSLEFTAKVTNNGIFTNQAQISASDQSDSDSIPNNGYSNGEDDQSSADLRTIE